MPSVHRHRFRAVLFAALQLGLSMGTAANLVFCSAASGHVAVESAFEADCCDRPPLTQTFSHADDGCGCVDTPLLQSPIESRSKGARLIVLLDATVLPSATSTSGSSPLATRIMGQHEPVPEQRLAAHRSVVLLL